MPGNEVGDRVHNFFGQENLSRVQYQQNTDGSWTALSNNLWSGNQRQSGAPLVSNLKNFSVHQSGGEHGHASQSSHTSHALNLAQLNQLHQRPESGRNQSQNQQSAFNGYMQGLQVLEPRQNEANFLSVDSESDRPNLTSRGLSLSESQQGNGQELYKKNLTRLDAIMSPVNFDLFGPQQQFGGRHPSLLQGFPRQHSGINDMQLLQQQFMLTQMQELQRQQLQPLEARQQNSINQASSFAKTAAGGHPASLINGIPVNEMSNLMWQPEIITANANWLQPSSIVQGSSGGLVLSPEQGQAMHLMGLVPQQAEQSLYGLPISSSRGPSSQHPHIQVEKTSLPQISTPNQYSQVQVDKSPSPQVPGSTNMFTVQHHTGFADEANKQERNSLSRQEIPGKNIFRSSVDQGLNSGLRMENSQQVNYQLRTGYVQEFNGKQDLTGLSEPSQEKSVLHVPPSQGAAALDPTEEKILFGSDDNLWQAFSGNSGFSMLDNTDCLNGFPSMQSGSWSALMQSAVAETSSNDAGAQEEWSGLTFRNMEPPCSIGTDCGKQQPFWTGGNLHMSSDSKSRSATQHEESKRLDSSSKQTLHGCQQSGYSSNDHPDKLQTASAHRSMPPFPERGKLLGSSPQKWLLSEGNNMYGSVANSSAVDSQTKSISSSRNHQQTPISCNSSSPPINQLNTWNLMESVSSDNSASLRNLENENLSQPHLRNDHERPMHEGGHGFSIWRPGPSIEPSTSNLQVFAGDSSNKALSSVSTRVNPEGIQPLSNSHRVDLWRDVGPSGSSRGNEGHGKHQHHVERGPRVLESLETNNLDKGASERHEIEKPDRKDTSTGGSLSDAFHHAGGGLRGPGRLNAGDSCSFPGSEPAFSGQVNQRSSASRKFQYHPMGDLEVDVEHSQVKKHVTNSQPLPLQLRDREYLDQSCYGPTSRNCAESEKVEAKGSDEFTSKRIFGGHLQKSLSPFDGSLGNYASIKASSSQNMLELLHKVDQVREHGIAKHISSHCVPSSKMSEPETSGGSIIHTQQTQGFGLQLGPPAQRSPIQEHITTPHSSPQPTVNSLNVNSETDDKGHSWLTTTQCMTSRDASQGVLRNNVSGSPGKISERGLQYNVPGNFSQALPSSFPFSRIHAHSENAAGFSGQVATSQSGDAPFVDRIAPNQIDRSDETVQINQPAVTFVTTSTLDKNFAISGELSQLNIANYINSGDPGQHDRRSVAVPGSQPYICSSMSEQGAAPKVYNVWTTVSTKQLPSDISLLTDKNVENVPGPQKSGSQDIENEGNAPSGSLAHTSPSQSSVSKEHSEKECSEQQAFSENTDIMEKMSASQGQDPLVKHAPDVSHFNSATQRDIEAFGRSLQPNSILHQNRPQMPQAQILRGTETDPNTRSIKRFKGLDGGLESEQLTSAGRPHSPCGYNAMVKDGMENGSSLPSADTKMLSFSSSPGNNRDGNESSQDIVAFDHKNSNSLYSANLIASSRGEHSLINPQMAPSWFNHFGTFKNGKMLSVYDVQKMAPQKLIEQCHVGKQSDNLHVCDSVETVKTGGDANQPTICPQIPPPVSVSSGNMPPLLLPSDASDRNVVVMRPKKRKNFTSELVPWHMELARSSERLHNISMAELDWARAANRLIEKVENDDEAIEELPPMVKPKRRLILTTQLMQQLLCPPSVALISTDVRLHYESLVYSVARSTLGDACRATSCSGNEILTSSSNRDLWSGQDSFKKVGDEYFLRVVGDLIGRAKKVENDLLRADSRASVLDLRVECQDLERFSVINRFAKFHGRGQSDVADTSSSSDTTGNFLKSFPQKYVTAVLTPKNLPDRVQCLSL